MSLNSKLLLLFLIVYSGVLSVLFIYMSSEIHHIHDKYESEIEKMRLQYIKEHEKLIEDKKRKI